MSKRIKSYLVSVATLIFSLLLFWPARPAAASSPLQAEPSPIEMDARVGFDGYVQQDAYFPVTVTLSNDGDDVDGELRVEMALSRTSYTRPVQLPRGSRKQVTFYAAGLSLDGDVRVDLVEHGRVLASQQVDVQSVSPGTLLVGLWSDTPQNLIGIGEVKPSSDTTVVALLSGDDLPPVGEGWRALDVLLIGDADTGQLTAPQRSAMRDWLMQGGRLIVVGGLSFQRTLSGLGEVTPVLARETVTVPVTPLAAYSLEHFGPQVGLETPVAVGPLAEGAQAVRVSEDVPLVVSRQVGYGQVDFLAADPGLEPLHSWAGLPDLWRGLLVNATPRPPWAYGFNRQWESARNAAASIPGVKLPSVFQLCGFLTLYAVLVGPVNYLVLRRMKRRELAWFTIPALVLLFSVIAYITGFQLRGGRAILHRLTIVQAPAGSEVAKVDALVGVWSPRRSRYDLQFEPGYLARPIPQDLGGALTNISTVTVEQSQAVTLRDVQVDVGSIQPLVVEGAAENPLPVESRLTYEKGSDYGYSTRVSGEIVNQSDIDLQDVTLILGTSTYYLGDFPAGSVLQIDQWGEFSPSSSNALDPSPYSAYGGFYYGYNPLVEVLHGEGDCWSMTDRRRRCDMVASIMQADGYPQEPFLTGWSEESPSVVEVLNAPSEVVGEAFYIVELPVELQQAGGQQSVEIPPSQMTWQLLEEPQEGYFYSPYDFWLAENEQLVLRFEPFSMVFDVQFDTITFTVEGYYYDEGLQLPLIEARNFNSGEWESLPVEVWGTTVIQNAERYIDPVGGVELRITGSTTEGVSISQLYVGLRGH